MLTFSDYTILVGLLTFAAFITYTMHEIACAIRSCLHD